MPAPRKPVDPTMRAVLDRAIFGPDWSVPPHRLSSDEGQINLVWQGARMSLKAFRDGIESARESGKYTAAGLQEKTIKLADAARAQMADMHSKVIVHHQTKLDNLRAQAKSEIRGKLDPIEVLTQQLRAQEIRQHLLSVDDTAFMQIAYDAKANGDLETLRAIQGIPRFIRSQIPTFDARLAQTVDEAVAELTITPATRQEIQALEEPISRAQSAQAGVLKEIEAELGTDPLAAILAKANQSTEENGDE